MMGDLFIVTAVFWPMFAGLLVVGFAVWAMIETGRWLRGSAVIVTTLFGVFGLWMLWLRMAGIGILQVADSYDRRCAMNALLHRPSVLYVRHVGERRDWPREVCE